MARRAAKGFPRFWRRRERGMTRRVRLDAAGKASRDAGAIPAASTCSEHASSYDSSRHITSEAATKKEVATQDDEGESGQQAASSVASRPPAATESATDVSEADRDLARVIAVWSDLQESVRASVMRIIGAG
jgi:hypothetical protein